MMMLMLLSYGIGWKKMATLLPRHVRKLHSKSFFESINSTKKELKKNPKTHFKNSSLISGLGFLLFFFFQSNGLVGLIPIGQKIGLYNTVNIR